MILPFPEIGRSAKRFKLTHDLFLAQWVVPAGTIVKLKQTDDFELVILPANCLDENGHIIPQTRFATERCK